MAPSPPIEKYQIGWICALSIEKAAAQEMLDENFGNFYEQDNADKNIYTLGRIGKHHVVIACLGGQYGTTSATTVANNMMRTFSQSLRIGLMVGIGGGIPTATKDIRLGDIVISYPTDTCGGVLQHDMGRVGEYGKFTRTGSLNSPPRLLLAAANEMKTHELANEPSYLSYIEEVVQKNTRTRRNFSRPEPHSDRLFHTEYEHSPPTAAPCDNCLAEWEVSRPEREGNQPQPHYGIVASGNTLIKHGKKREQLKNNTGALCCETEAAGLMQDFPCIIIRGICDYADSHKNDTWQGYAALAAASYTKELLGYVHMGEVSQESLLVDVCEGLKEELEGTSQRLDRAHNQQEQHHKENKETILTDKQQRCHQVFKTLNYEEQKDINPRPAEGTCQWALQSPEYIRWSESCDNDLLWVSADPGCGKSVLAKSIIDNYLEAPSSAVTTCYFFFKENDEQNNLASALCAILHQVFSQQPHLVQHAMPSWEKNGKMLQQEVNELWRIFMAATSAQAASKTICILDALDECREYDQNWLVNKLKDFHSQQCSPTQDNWLKFLVTSRPYDDIQDNFRATTNLFPEIHLKGEEENDQIHEEINVVVKIKVKEVAESAQLSSFDHQRLEKELLRMKHRTYLWLKLAIDDIRITFKNSLQPAEELIQQIPNSVNAAYEKILSRVSREPKQVKAVRKILQIIVAARRPLTTQEMAMALNIAIYPQPHAAKAPRDQIDLGEKIRQLCGLFVFINNSKIYLIHQTAREFLITEKIERPESIEWRQSVNLGDAHLALSEICMNYLYWKVCQTDYGQMSEDEEARLISGELSDYSAKYWIDHLRCARDPNIELLQLAGNLSGKENLSIWARFSGSCMWIEVDEPLPFFWVARWGLVDVADLLLKDSNIKITEEIMQKAAAHKSEKNTVMKLILDRRGDQIKITDKVLQEAAANPYGSSIMELLLDRKGDQIKITNRILRAAARNSGNGFSIMKLLLDRRRDQIKITDRILQAAAANMWDGDKILELLLDRGCGLRITSRGIYAALADSVWAEDIIRLLRPRSSEVKKIIQRTQNNQGYHAGRAGKWNKWVGQHKISKRARNKNK